jgi:hypothetical protein
MIALKITGGVSLLAVVVVLVIACFFTDYSK